MPVRVYSLSLRGTNLGARSAAYLVYRNDVCGLYGGMMGSTSAGRVEKSLGTVNCKSGSTCREKWGSPWGWFTGGVMTLELDETDCCGIRVEGRGSYCDKMCCLFLLRDPG